MSVEQPKLHTKAQVDRYYAEKLWGTKLLVDFLDANIVAAPEKIAVIDDREEITYSEFGRRTENLAIALIELGVKKGDVVAVQAENWADLPICHFATDRIGAIFLPLSIGFREMELRHILRKSNAKVLMRPDSYKGFSLRGMVNELRLELPNLSWVFNLRGRAEKGEFDFDEVVGNDTWRSQKDPGYLQQFRPTADDPSHIMVSSGTTGLPKCSLFSDNNSIVKIYWQYCKSVAGITKDDIAAALAPAGTGATGYNYPIMAPLLMGGTSAMLSHWDGKDHSQSLRWIEQHKCTYAVVVPAQLAVMVGAADIDKIDLGRLRLITNSGAKLPESVAERAEMLFGCKVQTIYGCSEAGAATMTAFEDTAEQRRRSVGRALLGQEVVVMNDEGVILGPNQPGEICWRGANKSYGFLNDFESTKSTWDADGWIHSGDLGEIDDEGYLRIVGRKKDMIIRGGQNINPRAVEEVLLTHPAILDVAVMPVEDQVLGERVAAFVILKEGRKLTVADLGKFIVDQGMAKWHQPEFVVPVEEFPRNAGGKVDKTVLGRHFRETRSAEASV